MMNKQNKTKNEQYKKMLEKNQESFCPFRKEFQMEVLESFLKKDLKGRTNVPILEACSGQGRLLYYLNQFDSAQNYTGFDYVSSFVDYANELFNNNENVQCYSEDIYNLPRKMHKKFDITILYKTLAWLPDYEKAIKALFKTARKKIYITTPLYEGDIEFEIKIKLNKQPRKESQFVTYYIYALPQIASYCKKLGAKKVRFHDLKLPFDLPKSNDKDILHTYTFRTKEDEVIEMTNIIKLDWKLIEITL